MQITTYSAFLDYLLDAGISPASPGELEDFFGFPVSIPEMKEWFSFAGNHVVISESGISFLEGNVQLSGAPDCWRK